MRKSRQITAFSLNRMDVSQRKGLYPTPQDAPEILGVEFAGHITALGPDTSGTWAIGDQVLGLASGVSQHRERTYSTAFKPSFSWFRAPMRNSLLYRKRRSSANRRNCLGWRPRAFQRLSSQASANSALPSWHHTLFLLRIGAERAHGKLFRLLIWLAISNAETMYLSMRPLRA
jgi:hypothetical protein